MSTTVAPNAPALHGTDSKALVAAEDKQLPDLKSSGHVVDRNKPLPTSLMSDFIPEDVLFALTQPPPVKDQLGPPSRTRNLNTSISYPRPPPNGVWNHKRRERFKHLTENPPCICGAGQDISFLYDVPNDAANLERPDKIDKSAVRKEMIDKQKKPLQLPDTLIPEEYHIVKNKGVMGIEFHEDKYSTQIQDHEKHLVLFPSMKPTSRYEVIQLKKTFNKMMIKLGITETDVEVKGPTQIHNLLELIKKEQSIFDTIFSELIRQTTIECAERGELLSEVRNKYRDLINNVPKQIMSLHEEVIAQRALDRRLTEELMRFKSTIGILTSELSAVKEHDKKVTKEAKQAQEDLKEALSEAQKNASLLSEYHGLYELQRKRLEKQVSMLTDERELWSNAAYSLALKVTEEANLTTAKRLHVSEKAWVKLATHFTILLSDRDTQVLTNLQGHVERWRDLVEEFKTVQNQREVEMKNNIKSIRGSVDHWMNEIRKICLAIRKSNAEGQFRRPPDDEKLKLFLLDMKNWEVILSKESEKYGGETLLEGQDKLTLIRYQMEGWTDNALKVFGRHRKDPTKNHPDQDRMVTLNQEVENLLHQFDNRITGENGKYFESKEIQYPRGVASRVIHLANGLETWDMKLTSHLNGTLSINDNEWGSLVQMMEDWLVGIDEAEEYVGTTQKEEDREKGRLHTSIDITQTVKKVQKWASSATNYIDSEDALLVEQVSQYHSKMVLWMVQMLLRLAPDLEGNSKEAAEMALIASLPLNELHSNIKVLIEQLEDFSRYVALCCTGIVMENTEQRRNNNEDNPEHELKDMNGLRRECKDWMNTAKILTSQLLEEPLDTLFPRPVSLDDNVPEKRKDSQDDYKSYHDQEKLQTEAATKPRETVSPTDTEEKKEPVQQPTAPPPEPQQQQQQQQQVPEKKEDMMEVIGRDDNTHKQTLEHSTDAPPTQSTAAVLHRMPGVPDPQKSFEALSAVDSLQTQLIATEQRAQESEERSANLEVELAASQEKLRELEKRLAKLEQGEAVPTEESTASAPQKVESVSPPKTPSKEKSDAKEDKKRPESTASKSSSKSSKSRKK
ncbi:axonemal dynein light chain domain-containing protein 1-like isoform X2 [Mytilus californianus]|uniref:axonemal dynein light chain domain-containing protein 1-like isoform X2 n=1 Tax=Mytilus californianus TaxID=6549 RepID=UPI002247A58D|nr:axonemal dynein light chain domain-containing protein 1-like isoform X2 [Mytilus californianus]